MTDWLTEWLFEWMTGWVTGWVTGLVIGRLTGWVTGWWMVEWLVDWMAEWLDDSLAEWLVEWLAEWLVEWLIGWVNRWLRDWSNGLLCRSAFTSELLYVDRTRGLKEKTSRLPVSPPRPQTTRHYLWAAQFQPAHRFYAVVVIVCLFVCRWELPLWTYPHHPEIKWVRPSPTKRRGLEASSTHTRSSQ